MTVSALSRLAAYSAISAEKTRIGQAGGYVEYGRVNGRVYIILSIIHAHTVIGNLALSRAIGDFEFKKNYGLPPEKQIITSDPDVTCHEISDEDEFLVLACDGMSRSIFVAMNLIFEQVSGTV